MFGILWRADNLLGSQEGLLVRAVIDMLTQLVEALRYKPEGRGFDSRWCHWNFPLTQSFRPHYGPGVDSAVTEMSTRNISWGVKAAGARAYNLTTFMCWLSWNLGASTFWNPQGLSRTVQGLLYLYALFEAEVCDRQSGLQSGSNSSNSSKIWYRKFLELNPDLPNEYPKHP